MAGRQRKTDTLRKATFVPAGGGAHLSWLGQRLRYLTVGEQTLGRFALAAASIPPGGGLGPHVQRRGHEGFYLLSGELLVTAGNRHLTLPPGGFLNIAPETPHRLTNAGSEAAEVLLFFGPAGFDELQFRAGLPLASPEEAVPATTDDDRALLASSCPGIRCATRSAAGDLSEGSPNSPNPAGRGLADCRRWRSVPLFGRCR